MLAKGWANATASVSGRTQIIPLDAKQFNKSELVDERGIKEPMPISGTKSYNDSKLKTEPFFDQWGYRVASVKNLTTFNARSLNKNELRAPLSSSYNNLMQVEPSPNEPTERHSLMTLLAKVSGNNQPGEILKLLKSLSQRKADYVAEHAKSAPKRQRWKTISGDIQRLEIERDAFRKTRLIADIVKKSDGLIRGVDSNGDLIFIDVFGDLDGFAEEEQLEVKEEHKDKNAPILASSADSQPFPIDPSAPVIPAPVKKKLVVKMADMTVGLSNSDIDGFLDFLIDRVITTSKSKSKIVDLVSDSIEEVKAPGIEDADVIDLVDSVIAAADAVAVSKPKGMFDPEEKDPIPESEPESVGEDSGFGSELDYTDEDSDEEEAPRPVAVPVSKKPSVLFDADADDDEEKSQFTEKIPSDWAINEKQLKWQGVFKEKNQPLPEVQDLINNQKGRNIVSLEKLNLIANELGVELNLKAAKKRNDSLEERRGANIRKIFGSANPLTPLIYKYWAEFARSSSDQVSTIIETMKKSLEPKAAPASPKDAPPAAPPAAAVQSGVGYQIGSGKSRSFKKSWGSTKSRNNPNTVHHRRTYN